MDSEIRSYPPYVGKVRPWSLTIVAAPVADVGEAALHRQAILTHPTVAVGLTVLFGAVPVRAKTGGVVQVHDRRAEALRRSSVGRLDALVQEQILSGEQSGRSRADLESRRHAARVPIVGTGSAWRAKARENHQAIKRRHEWLAQFVARGLSPLKIGC